MPTRHHDPLQIIRDTVDKPKQLTFKSTTDIVTETDKASEAACIAAIRAAFPTHAILVRGAAAAAVARLARPALDPCAAAKITGNAHLAAAASRARRAA